MKKIKVFSYFILLIFILSSCGGLGDIPKILRNEKIKTTDEFLVKKREPLTEPPDLKQLPIPKSSSEEIPKEKNKIKTILKAEEEKDNIGKSKSSSVEDTILNNIRR